MQTLVIVLYLVTLGVLALYGVHRGALLLMYLRHRGERTTPLSRYAEADLPMVTVQLPMFNELCVAERLIDAVARVDYPRDRLEIQVLDDSTDATSTIARSRCDALRQEGRTAERERVKAILAAPEAEGRADLARSLALETDLDVTSALRVLSSAPEQTKGGAALSAAMANVRNPVVGADDPETEEDAAVEAMTARALSSLGHKPEKGA